MAGPSPATNLVAYNTLLLSFTSPAFFAACSASDCDAGTFGARPYRNCIDLLAPPCEGMLYLLPFEARFGLWIG